MQLNWNWSLFPLPTPAHHPTPGCPQALEQRLRSGATIADIEREFRAPQPPPQQQQQAPAAAPKKAAAKAPAAPPQAAPAPPPPPPATPVVGRSMGMRQRNPLDLIRRSDGSGQLMSSKPKYLRTPLTSLLEQAQAEKDAGRLVWYRVSARGRGGRCLVLGAQLTMATSEALCCTLQTASPVTGPPFWLQLYDLGDKRELLVTAQLEDPSNPDSTVTVDMTTTLPEGGEWLALRPSFVAAVCGSGCASKAAVHGGHVVEGRSKAGIMLAGRLTASWQTSVVELGAAQLSRFPPPTHLSTRLTRPNPLQPCCTGVCARLAAAPTGCSRRSSC